MGLKHEDTLIDADVKCVIDINTRKVTSSSSKNVLLQFDHKSERVGFTMPRYNDGHDMSLTDRVTILYSNGSNGGAYVVDDLAVGTDDEETVEFSWLIDNSATQNATTLAFGIDFRCFDSSGNVTYRWATQACSVFTVLENVWDTSDTVDPQFNDVLANIQAKLDTLDGAVSGDISSALETYLSENPISMKKLTFTGAVSAEYDGSSAVAVNIPSGGSGSGSSGTAATIKVGTVTTGAAGSSASVTNSGTSSAAVFDFVIPKGDKGDKGDAGAAGTNGTTPVRGTDYWTSDDIATIKAYVDEAILGGTW